MIQVGCTAGEISPEVKKLVIFDHSLSMQAHMTTVASICYSYLSKPARIRRYLDKEECKKIFNCSVIYEMDYRNVFLYCMNGSALKFCCSYNNWFR